MRLFLVLKFCLQKFIQNQVDFEILGTFQDPGPQGVRLSADHLDHPAAMDARSAQTPQKRKCLPLSVSPDSTQEAFLSSEWIAELDRNFTPLAQCHWQVGGKGKLRHKFHCEWINAGPRRLVYQKLEGNVGLQTLMHCASIQIPLFFFSHQFP